MVPQKKPLRRLKASPAATGSARPVRTCFQGSIRADGISGSGHYVKMVHNGIEYGDMQLIAEAYDILKRGLDLNEKEIADIFSNVLYRSLHLSHR